MDYAIITLVAFVISGLTLFSGFGLGTVLMPAFALFFPVPTAIAATAVVHLANNIFKVALVGKDANWSVVLRFGLPAAVSSLLGASALVLFAILPPVESYELLGQRHEVTAIKLVIGVLIVAFALLELSPAFVALAIPPRYLVLGGLISGFFGGFSGNQGAFRSAFLIKAGLSKESFVATGVISAVIVDVVRLTIYGASYITANFDTLQREIVDIVITATLAAFLGSLLASRILKKVTLRAVQVVVAATMIVVGSGLAVGLI